MARFEKVSKFSEVDINLPCRKTIDAAGYDMEVAEDVVVPSFFKMYSLLKEKMGEFDEEIPFSLEHIANITKTFGVKPTLVSTGMKCYIEPDHYLELSVRSSCPLKYWLMMANSVGIIDADYYNNPDNEGEIFFQMINLSPFDIKLKKGDIIGQGIIKPYVKCEDDKIAGGAMMRTGGFGSTDG